MESHSTKAMAARAVDLCVALLHEQPSIESVSRILRDHGETGDLDLGEADVAAMRAAATRLCEVRAAVHGLRRRQPAPLPESSAVLRPSGRG
ncbi:hypothetical protein [Nonomuraea sp. NPDC049695]|uniref:hypothetical protein n=1 Tax=Nonomuraea sp. NPDC049695 TaxID=3154734 RepID=UPI003446424B